MTFAQGAFAPDLPLWNDNMQLVFAVVGRTINNRFRHTEVSNQATVSPLVGFASSHRITKSTEFKGGTKIQIAAEDRLMGHLKAHCNHMQ